MTKKPPPGVFPRLIQKTTRAYEHLQSGTFFEALQENFHRYSPHARTARSADAQWHARAKLWATCRASGKPFVDEIRRDLKMYLYPDDLLSASIYEKQFEVNEQNFLIRYLHRGDVFVDVGANIGIFTVMAADRVGRSGLVFSFEPCAETFSRLETNLKLNGFKNAVCLRLALSDTQNTQYLYQLTGGYGAFNSLAPPTLSAGYDQVEVQCTTWDSFEQLNEAARRVCLMKIDVEGWELRVLNGAAQALARPNAPDLLVEFTDANAQAAGTSCAALYERLVGFGYRMYRFGPDHSLRYESLQDAYPYTNLLATKDVMSVCRRTKFSLEAQYLPQ
jgi:FkbM family methyltransferase